MLKAIPQPREDVSDWAPKMTTMHINPDKIREVIGKGGSVIQNIVAESGAKVDIEDSSFNGCLTNLKSSSKIITGFSSFR